MEPYCTSHGGGAGLWQALHERDHEIHFIGASVTVQRGSWAEELVRLLRQRTGREHVLTKNAMGGVGLLFGVANYAPPAGALPRVVFIEYSTGDLNLGLTPLDELPGLLEHVVQRARGDGSEVLIVHNWRADFDADDRAGVRALYDGVASRLGVPVIDNHRFAHACIAAEPALREAWFRDVCHTLPEGGLRYAEHTLACLAAMAAAPGEPGAALPNATPPAAVADPVGFVEPAAPPGLAPSSFTYPGTLQRFGVLESADGFEFVASGQLMGIGFISGPRAGWVDLWVDGTRQRRFRCFDRHSHYERYILLPVFLNLARAQLRLVCAPEPVDFTMAAKPHPDFALDRTIKLVHFVGRGLRVEE